VKCLQRIGWRDRSNALEKEGDETSVKGLALPNASFLDENWNSTPLNSSSIAKFAKNCSPVYGTDPEIVSGRVSLPHDKQSIFLAMSAKGRGQPCKNNNSV
jgi:hypothetical protein